ncbi:MAG: beta-xylosidase [Chitinophagaceae bacterium]|nr:MAG: beta-xylosidase [Chitinophagaceae bacterium]
MEKNTGRPFPCFLVLLFFLLVSVNVTAQGKTPAFINGDFADPSVIRAGDSYYAVGTSSEWAPHFPIYHSANLTDWTLSGYVFDRTPEWISGSFWAPEFYYHNKKYYVYYTARRKSDGISCIGVATSDYPDHGFTDHGVIVDYGKEAIDAFIYNDNGQLYISFKAFGLDNRPIELLGSRLSPDGLKMQGEVFSMLKDTARRGMEGQSIIKKDNWYYLFYSSGDCCGNGCSYDVRVTRSRDYQGPYEYLSTNPVLQTYGDWKCPGHGTFVTNPQGNTSYIYHAYNRQTNVFTGREGLIADLKWDRVTGWPMLYPRAVTKPKPLDFSDDFKTASSAWQWDFRHAAPVVSRKNGQLTVSGTVTPDNLTGIALTVRPVSTDFEMTTTVLNHNEALKGLVFYGDAGAAVGIGVQGSMVRFWSVRDTVRTIIAEVKIDPLKPVKLRLKMKSDLSCEVYYSQGTGEWLFPVVNKTAVGFLPQWDRSPRPGLHVKAANGEQAVFGQFQIINK